MTFADLSSRNKIWKWIERRQYFLYCFLDREGFIDTIVNDARSTFYLMLGTFPKDFYQVATSQVYFPKWQFSKCAIFQAGTSQVCPSRSARPSACYSRSGRPHKPS